MSGTDPLVKSMKKNVYHLTMDQPVTDQHAYLHLFCEQLELLFRRGLKPNMTIFHTVMIDYWKFLEAFYAYLKRNRIKCHPFIEISIETVKSSVKIKTEQGKGRLLIRMLLQNKCLDNFVQLMNTHASFLETWYFRNHCLFYDSIQTEIFISVLKQMNELKLKFCIDNQSFLDETWILPVFQRLTLVPSKTLGIEIIHKSGYAIVFRLNENGVAAENGQMEPGDVLDEVFNKPLKDTHEGFIPHYLKANKGKPIEVAILKGHLPDGSIFGPLLELTNSLPAQFSPFQRDYRFLNQEGKPQKLKIPPHAKLSEDCDEEIPVHNASDRAEYECTYVGYVSIGEDGSICKIEEAIDNINKLLQHHLVLQQLQNKLQHCMQEQQQQQQQNEILLIENDKTSEQKQSQEQQFWQQQQKQLQDQMLFLQQQKVHNTGVLQQFDTLVHLGETDFTVFKNKEVFIKASYTEISACGRKDDKSELFACIIGETTCTLAKNFVAHVLKAKNHLEAKIILCTIAQGFERTHYFV